MARNDGNSLKVKVYRIDLYSLKGEKRAVLVVLWLSRVHLCILLRLYHDVLLSYENWACDEVWDIDFD